LVITGLITVGLAITTGGASAVIAACASLIGTGFQQSTLLKAVR
jgi:hypothetical protein